MKPILLILSIIALSSCRLEKIENGENLSTTLLEKIKSYGLLNPQESIILFYSNDHKEKAGSFFTNQRVAHYWIDEDPQKTEVNFAYYRDIKNINPHINISSLRNCPYLTILRKDGSSFKIYVDGSKKEKEHFYEMCNACWQQ